MKAVHPGTWFMLLASAALAGPPTPTVPAPAPLLGLAIEFAKPPGAELERKASAEVRETGVNLFVLTVSWSQAEPAPGKYRIAEVTRAARILRQSGATVHLDLPLVAGRIRDVPKDLAAVAFDDSKLSLRLGRLLDALGPALADTATISLGYAADAYFVDKPEELQAYKLLFEGAVEFLKKVAPHLSVGVTTTAPGESPAPGVAAQLHQKSPVLFYVYAPFLRDKPFVHRGPESLETDWKRLLASAGGRPIAFPAVSFSSAAENGSSPAKQADFVRRLRRFLAGSDGRKLLFARYVGWRDPPPELTRVPPGASDVVRREASFYANRGLKGWNGEPKPAWREWARKVK